VVEAKASGDLVAKARRCGIIVSRLPVAPTGRLRCSSRRNRHGIGLVAYEIHRRSRRKDNCVASNCASSQRVLYESEFSAMPGALSPERSGRFGRFGRPAALYSG